MTTAANPVNRRQIPPQLLTAVVSSAAGGVVEAVTAVASQKILVWGWDLTWPSGTLTVKSGTAAQGGAVTATGWQRSLPVVANPMHSEGFPYYECGTAEAFNLDMSEAVQLSGTVYYSLVTP